MNIVAELEFTARIVAGLTPHALLAVTEIFPLFEPAVAVIEFVFENPDQPPGIPQV